MDVTVTNRNLAFPPHAWESVSARIRSAFSRLRGRVARISVNLREVTGRGNHEARECTLQAELTDGSQIVVVQRAGRTGAALAAALMKARQAVRRELRLQRAASRRQRRNNSSRDPGVDGAPGTLPLALALAHSGHPTNQPGPFNRGAYG